MNTKTAFITKCAGGLSAFALLISIPSLAASQPGIAGFDPASSVTGNGDSGGGGAYKLPDKLLSEVDRMLPGISSDVNVFDLMRIEAASVVLCGPGYSGLAGRELGDLRTARNIGLLKNVLYGTGDEMRKDPDLYFRTSGVLETYKILRMPACFFQNLVFLTNHFHVSYAEGLVTVLVDISDSYRNGTLPKSWGDFSHSDYDVYRPANGLNGFLLYLLAWLKPEHKEALERLRLAQQAENN
jgi:hypothetical protein